MIGGGTAASVSAAAPLASSLPVELSAADRARVDQALLDSRAANTRAQYRSAWRGWAEWSALNGHATLPADPLAIAAYLAYRSAQAGWLAPVGSGGAALGGRAGRGPTGAASWPSQPSRARRRYLPVAGARAARLEREHGAAA